MNEKNQVDANIIEKMNKFSRGRTVLVLAADCKVRAGLYLNKVAKADLDSGSNLCGEFQLVHHCFGNQV